MSSCVFVLLSAKTPFAVCCACSPCACFCNLLRLLLMFAVPAFGPFAVIALPGCYACFSCLLSSSVLSQGSLSGSLLCSLLLFLVHAFAVSCACFGLSAMLVSLLLRIELQKGMIQGSHLFLPGSKPNHGYRIVHYLLLQNWRVSIQEREVIPTCACLSM